MPDLGKYAIEVLSAYGLSIGLLCIISGLTIFRHARVRRRLAEAEARRNG